MTGVSWPRFGGEDVRNRASGSGERKVYGNDGSRASDVGVGRRAFGTGSDDGKRVKVEVEQEVGGPEGRR